MMVRTTAYTEKALILLTPVFHFIAAEMEIQVTNFNATLFAPMDLCFRHVKYLIKFLF